MSRRILMAILLLQLTFSHSRAQSSPDGALADKNPLVRNLPRFDTNNDGKLSRDEVLPNFKRVFTLIDSNHDGFLEAEELRQLPLPLRDRQRFQTFLAEATERLVTAPPKGIIVEANLAYREGESKAWRLDLARPEKDGDRPRPAIVFVHGGGWRIGDKRGMLKDAVEFAQRGYVCITVKYRLLDEAPFPACIEDVKCAVRWLRAHARRYNVDPKRIGGFGHSAGGHLVGMLGLAGPDALLEGDGPYQDQSSLLQVVCFSSAMTSLEMIPARWAKKMSTETRKRFSPITYADDKAPPFLVIHGTADSMVDIEHGDSFVNALKKSGAKHVEYLRIDGANHGILNLHFDKIEPAMVKFFATHLRHK